MNARLNIGLMRQISFIALLLRRRRHVYMLNAAPMLGDRRINQLLVWWIRNPPYLWSLFRPYAVILHRLWCDGTDFIWSSKEVAA